MKKSLLLTLALVLVVAVGTSADEVYIPSNTPSTGSPNVIPFGGVWPASNVNGEFTYQWFIPAKALGGKSFRITGLASAPAVNATHTATMGQILVSHTTLTAPSLTFALNLPNPTTLRTAGSWTWKAVGGTWSPHTLDKGAGFNYNGTDSLCIEIRLHGSTATTLLNCHSEFSPAPVAKRIFAHGPGASKATVGTLGSYDYCKIRITVMRISLTGVGAPKPGGKVTLNLDAPVDAGNVYQMASSLGTGPIAIDTRKLGLTLDPLMIVCVQGLLPSVFQSYSGKLDANGKGTAAVAIPNQPAFIGVRLHSAFVTLKIGAPSNISQISPTYTFSIMK